LNITDTEIILTFDDMLFISKMYNRSAPDSLRRDNPTEYMVGVWLGWFFANNANLAPYISSIVQITIVRPDGWEPGDVIPGEPDPHPGVIVEIDHADRRYRLTTSADGLIALPRRLAGRKNTIGRALVAAINATRIGRSR